MVATLNPPRMGINNRAVANNRTPNTLTRRKGIFKGRLALFNMKDSKK